MKKAFSLIAFVCICLLASNKTYAQTFMELNSQFMALFNKEAYKEAIPVGIKALASAKKEYGEDNINYAISANNLAHAYYSNNQPNESLPYFHIARRSYRAVYKTLGVEKIAYCDNMIGQVYTYQKRYDSAAIFLEKAFDFFVSEPDEHYEDALVVMNNLTNSLYLPLKKYKEAQKVYEVMVEAILKKEGFKGDNFRFTFYNYLLMLNNQGLHAAVDTVCQMLLPIIGEQVGKKSLTYAYSALRYGQALYELKRTDTAVKYLLEALPTLDASSQDGYLAANCNNFIGLSYLDKKRYDSSAYYLKRGFDYFLAHYQEDYNDLMIVGQNLSTVYFTNNRSGEHIGMLQKLLPIIEKAETALSENYCRNLYYLVVEYKQQRDLISSNTHAKKLVMLREKLNGNKSKLYAVALDSYGNGLTELNNTKEAEAILLKSLSIKQSLAEKDTLELGMSYIMLGHVYAKQSDFNKSYNSYNTAIWLYEKAKLSGNDQYFVALKSLAYTYVEGNRFSDAKVLLNKLLALQTKTEGENFSGNADILITLGNAEYQLNELTVAQEHANKGLTIAKNNFGEANYIVANAKELLAFLSHRFGNSNAGITLFKEALSINKKMFTEESNEYASTLSNIGVVYTEMGLYAEAEEALIKSVAIRGRVLGKEHPYYALSVLNLSMVYTMQSNYEKSNGFLKGAMDIYINKGLTSSPIYIKILNNFTFNISNMGAYSEAKKLYLLILSKVDTTDASSFQLQYLIFNNLSATCLALDEYDEAIKYAQRAIVYVKNEQGTKSLEYIKSINNLFIAYKKAGKLAEAQKIINELIPICKEVLDKDADLLGTIYHNASLLANEQGKMLEASSYMKLGLDIIINNFRRNFYTLSEKEKLIWWEDKAAVCYFYPALLMQYPNHTQEMVNDVVNLQLQLKGFVMNDATASLKKARATGNKQLNSLIDQWQSTRTLVSKQLALPLMDRYLKLDSLETVANNYEKQINQLSAGLISVSQQKEFNWKNVQSVLKDGEAAVEYINFPFFRGTNYTDTVQYAAIVITKNKPPQFIPLATEKQISWCITGDTTNNNKQAKINSLYRSSLKGNNSNNNTNFVGDSLYNLIWKPLLPALQNATTVYYAPDGLLHKVAFHALPTGTNKLLLDESDLQQFTSIKQLAERSSKEDKWNNVYLMGNADFNTLSSTSSNNAGTIFRSKNKNASSWSALPGTEKEVNTLKPLFESKQLKVTATSKITATEESFKALNNNSPSIIHLATHGFFLPVQKINTKIDMDMLEEVGFASNEDPLLRSGIIMAGANKAWGGEQVPANVEDGIVTAFEIAQLNLSNTKLVVLSACETALGDVQGTEGVFGLQRAFKIAGAKNLIVSLWQVPDKETAELMTIFYGKLLTGIPVREAFYKAQKEMRSKYAPYLWAAFVLVE